MQLVVAPEKRLTKIVHSLLTFFDISQALKCLSILSPNITTDFFQKTFFLFLIQFKSY